MMPWEKKPEDDNVDLAVMQGSAIDVAAAVIAGVGTALHPESLLTAAAWVAVTALAAKTMVQPLITRVWRGH